MHVRLAFSVMIQVDADDPARRRGPRGRRRRLPAEVLRRLLPHARGGQDDPVRDARHGSGAALLSPGAAARARRGDRHRRAEGGRRSLPAAQLRGHLGRPGRRLRRPSRRATALRAWRRPGSRTSRAAGSPRSSRVGRAPSAHRSVSARRSTTPRSRWRSSTRSGRTCSWQARRPAASRAGRFEAGEEVEFEVSFENALAPGRYAVSTLVSRPDGEIVDRWEGIFTFVVTGARRGRRPRRPAPTISPSTRSGSRAAGAPRQRMSLVEVRGPIGGERRRRGRFAALTVHLAAMEFKLRFFGSVLGYLWQLVRPLMLFGGALRRVHAVRQAERGRRLLPGRAAERDRALHVLRRRHRASRSPRCSTARTSSARSSSRGWSCRCPWSAQPCCNLAANLLAVLVFVARLGRRAARLDGSLAVPGWPSLVLFAVGAAIAAVGALPALPRPEADLGGRGCRSCSTRSPILYVIEVIPDRTLQKLIMLNPLAADRSRSPPHA